MNTNSKIGKTFAGPEFLKTVRYEDLLLEAAVRRQQQSITALIEPASPSQMVIDLTTWKRAYMAAMNVYSPNMNPLYEVYDNIRIDNGLTANIDTRILKVQQSKFNLVDQAGKPNPEARKLFERQWFLDFIRHCMESRFEGFRLLEIIELDDKNELKACKAINKYHVKGKKGIVTKDPGETENGTSYLDDNYALYYIPVGDPDDLGILYKVAPIVLAKKYALGHWGEFNEKMGIPFRTVTTNAANTKRQEQLGVIMQKMGSAGWAVLNEGEKVELMSISGTDPTKCFDGLISVLNSERAMLIMGQSSTSNSDQNKGTYGSMAILQEISDDRHEADLVFLKYIINDLLIPRLIQISPAYKSLNNLSFDWDKSVDLSVDQIVDYVVQLSTVYNIPADFVTEKTGIPIEGIKPVPNGPAPAAPASKKKSLTANIQAFYNPCCSTHFKPNAAGLPDFEEDLLRIAKDLYDGKKNDIVDIGLIKKTATYLQGAINTGYGKEVDKTDAGIISSLNRNVYVFSGFKNYQILRDVTNKLVDEKGNTRSFQDFKTEVLKLNNDYNLTYLKAEYDHAMVGSQMASQWQQIQRDKNTLPYLKFVATEDNRTTQICRQLDGTLLPVDHPFWEEHYLPLHWGERSLIQQVDRGPITDAGKVKDLTDLVDPEIKPMFKNNIGKSGVLFPETHPYFQAPAAARKEIMKEVDKLSPDPGDYRQVYKSKNGGTVQVHSTHNPDEIAPNTTVAKILAGIGHQVKLLPYSYDRGVKNPDASIDGAVADFKGVAKTTQAAIQNAIKKASAQTAETVVISLPSKINKAEIILALLASFQNAQYNKNIAQVWLIRSKKVFKISRKDVVAKKLDGLF